MLIQQKAQENSNREVLPNGIYKARCIGVVDLGTQETPFDESKKHQLLLLFELPEKLIEVTGEKGSKDFKPMQVSKYFTMSLHEKSALRPFISGWDPEAIRYDQMGNASLDIESFLDRPVQLHVTVRKKQNSEETYNFIQSALPVPAGVEWPERVARLISWDFGNQNENDWHRLPEYIQKKLRRADEFNEFASGDVGAEIPM